ncbi:MAG: n-acetylglutamate synthase [Chitinophagaceae bacterium]
MINYHNKIFRAVSNSANGETSVETIFNYFQEGNLLSGNYFGGKIKMGNLLGIVSADGALNFSYHHINDQNEVMAGTCTSIPELLPNGKIRLHETWRWTSVDKSTGNSIIDEI